MLPCVRWGFFLRYPHMVLVVRDVLHFYLVTSFL